MHKSADEIVVSVITVNYNNKDGLQKSLDSFIAQTHQNKELIVVDGGSNDGSIDIIEQYKANIKVSIIGQDKGIYDAMNIGIENVSSKSDYIHFLNSGDSFYSPDVLSELARVASKDQSQSYFGNIIRAEVSTQYPVNLNYRILAAQMICHQAVFFRTAFHKKNLYDLKYNICADYKILAQALAQGEKFRGFKTVVCEIETEGVSATQRQKLKAQKQAIRKEFPALRLWKTIRKLKPT